MMAVSQEVIKTLHDEFSKIAIAIFNDGKEVIPQCFLVGVDDDGNITHTEATPLELMAFFMGSENGKDVFAKYMKSLLDDTHEGHRAAKKAFGFSIKVLVHISEAWMRTGDKDSLDEPPPSQHPDRQEVILVSVHTRQGTTMNMHKIMDQPERHAVFKELEVVQTVTGRLTMQDAFGFRDNPVH